MSDWVHCNVCYIQPVSGKQFHLTNCGHIICNVCLSPSESNNTCKVCRNSCSTIILSAKMKPEVEMFFTDPIELVKKNERQMLQVLEFQRNHRKKLGSHIGEKLTKQGAMLTDSHSVREQVQQLAKENGVLRAEVQYLRKYISNMSACTGQMFGSSSSGNHRTAMESSELRSETSPSVHKPMMYRTSPLQQSQVGSAHTKGSVHDSRSATTVHQSPKLSSRTPPGFQSAGPSRVTLRTPPSNGRLGIIPPYSITPEKSMKMPTTPSRSSSSPYSTGLAYPAAASRSTPSSMNNPEGFTTPQQYTRNANH